MELRAMGKTDPRPKDVAKQARLTSGCIPADKTLCRCHLERYHPAHEEAVI
jgi:hypothetical protein